MPRTEARPATLADLGIERKPFYTPAEVAQIMAMSDQSVLDRIHLPAGHPQHVYAIALGPRTYRIPIGALAQLAGLPPQVTIGTRPRRIDEIAGDEHPRRSTKPTRSR